MSNGDPNAPPLPDFPDPGPGPGVPRFPGRGGRGDSRDQFPQGTRARFPVPVPVDPIFVPPPPVAIPPAATPGPVRLGTILSRANIGVAIGAIAIELLERIFGELQAREARELLDVTSAELEMLRRRVLIKQRDERVATQTAGDVALPPPKQPPPPLSDQDRFPFPDPFEDPLGDDPLPGTITGPAPKPLPGFVIPLPEAPLPAPIADPVTLPAPSLPEPVADPQPKTAPAPAPTTRPGTPGRVAPGPFPTPIFSPTASPSPRFRISPLTDPRGVTQPRTGTPTDTAVPTDLTQPQTVGVPLRTSNCPPCTKDESREPRSQCFKKLVKEGLFADMDESFNWTEIDCFTGREI